MNWDFIREDAVVRVENFDNHLMWLGKITFVCRAKSFVHLVDKRGVEWFRWFKELSHPVELPNPKILMLPAP